MTGVRDAVLVVEADASLREQYGTWLEDSGFEVLVCPGPTEPDYTCVGGRGAACPLAAEVDLVVLDMSLDSEAVLTGTAAEEILALYLMTGKRIIVLGSHPGEEVEGQLARMNRHPERDELVDALRSMRHGTAS
jgi:CheY-like chemotaxis protein